ncbi:TetR/AcrR family transcriptional regulator [Singulisphaera rosea]
MTNETTSETTSEVARHIARVAARLFATQGYDATSVRTIVEEAGVTKPTLYYHFGSKEGLAQALFRSPMIRLNEALQKILDEGKDPVEMLVQVVEARFAFCREDPDCTRFVLSLFFGPHASGLVGEMERFKGGVDCQMFEVFRRAAEAGVIDPDRVESFAKACMGLIFVSILEFLYKNGELGPDLAGRLVGDLLTGFGTPETPRRGIES